MKLNISSVHVLESEGFLCRLNWIASLEAITGITNHILFDAALKLKMAIVSDGKWVAVALYGDSAIHPITNHERAGLGIMHI